MGRIRVTATCKPESGKLLKSVKRLQSEIPNRLTASISMEDADDVVVVFLSEHNTDYRFIANMSEASKQIMPKLEKVLIEITESLPLEPKNTCPWGGAVRNSRFE